MNTTRLIITTASLSLSSLMLSNCATIKELREREDPHSLARMKKVKNSSAQELSNKTNANPTASAPIAVSKPASSSSYTPLPTLPTRDVQTQSQRSTAVSGQRRRVSGLMTPDAGKLPSNKDLQEVQAPSSHKKSTPGINIPTQP